MTAINARRSGSSRAPRLFRDRIRTPIGDVLVASGRTALHVLEFADAEARVERALRRRFRAVATTEGDPLGIRRALAAYFDGDLRAFETIPVDAGGTPFQERVWRALRQIPVGTTTSYGALAARLGRPTATRAVGLANAANPIAIVVPCHRVIGAGGALTGYGGGLARKRWLLEHEGAIGGARAIAQT